MKVAQLYQIFTQSTGICTDTRKIVPGCLFFALKGEKFDGNTFTVEALEKGASHVVIDNINYLDNSGKTILCGNVLKMLQKLANFHRKNLKLPVLAITGSNGKTTTKELVQAVLAQKFRVAATQGNLNNHIGVPLTLLSMTSEDEIGIVEMGANHLKEIEMLAEIAEPDYGYITNFGKAHLEGFGSLEGVIRGKTELYKHLKSHGKVAFVNANDPNQLELSKSLKRIRFGNEEQDHYIALKDSRETVIVQYGGEEIVSNLVGLYNFHNIAAAIAIGAYFEVPTQKIKMAIEAYIPEMNRSQIVQKDGKRIILDAYNANPTSMMAAIENLQQAPGDQKVLILGDMFELGKSAAHEHQEITNYLEKNDFGKVYLVGSNFFGTESDAPHIERFENFEALKEYLLNHPLPASQLLIKGSRGMALERILEIW